MTKQLWAPWRLEYITQADEETECIFCRAASLSDEDGLVVHRGEHAFVLLNKFPYASGHLMVAPSRHVGDYTDLEPAEAAEIHALTVRALEALRVTAQPHGFNVGWNLGTVAGGSIAAHLHQHVVPRWGGDTNFMPVVGHTKVLPQLLGDTRTALAKAWPSA